MKSLLTLAIFSLISTACFCDAHASSCNLTLKSKKADSASAKIGDVTFSKKQIEALKTQCNVSRASLSQDELIQLETIAFNKRIARMKKQ